MPSYPAGITVSSRALITLTDALRQRRTQRGTRWRRLAVGQQALLVLAHPQRNSQRRQQSTARTGQSRQVPLGDVVPSIVNCVAA